MHPAIVYLLKMLLCSAILLGYYWAALRNERFHQWNRFYLLAAMFLSVVIPFINIPLLQPKQPTVVVDIVAALPWNSVVIVQKSNAAWNWKDYVTVSMLFVSGLLLLHMIRSIWKVVLLYRRNSATYFNEVSIVITEEKSAPFSFFKWLFWRSDIDLESSNGQRMLQHELTHIREKHSADKLFTELLLIVFWMNPFFWMMRKELFAIHEFLADRKAIDSHDGAAFATMILQAIHYPPALSLSNPFFTSHLKRRLIMITTSKKPAYTYLRRIGGMVCFIITALLLTLGVQHSQAQIRDANNVELLYKGKKISEIKIDYLNNKVKLVLEDKSTVNKTIKETSDEKILPETMLKPKPPAKNADSSLQKAIAAINASTVMLSTLPAEEQKPYLIAVTGNNEEILIGTQNGTSEGINGKLFPMNQEYAVQTDFKKIVVGDNPKLPTFFYNGKEVSVSELHKLTSKHQEYKIAVYRDDYAETLYGAGKRYGVVAITDSTAKGFVSSVDQKTESKPVSLIIKYNPN